MSSFLAEEIAKDPLSTTQIQDDKRGIDYEMFTDELKFFLLFCIPCIKIFNSNFVEGIFKLVVAKKSSCISFG